MTYVCITPCPELDLDNAKHCALRSLTEHEYQREYECPCGNTPVWEEREVIVE